MGIRTFLGFRSSFKRGQSRRKGAKKQASGSRHHHLRIEPMEPRWVLGAAPVLTLVTPSTGPTGGGTQVLIAGTDLAGATAVNFGTQAAKIVVDTATLIVVTSPAERAGSVDVTVTTSSGISALSAVDKFTYYAIGPQLVAILPNTGTPLNAGDILNTAPTQLTFEFNQNEQIDPNTLSGIAITYTNAAGKVSPAPIGYLAVNDSPDLNEVIVRFSQTLASGSYTISIVGVKGAQYDPTSGAYGLELPFNDGLTYSMNFTLDLGSIVNAVVPQPVSRTAGGQLQQAVNEVDVYFTDQLNASSATNPQFYQLIATNNTADTSATGGQSQTNPAKVVYNYNAATNVNYAQLFFSSRNPTTPTRTTSRPPTAPTI